MFNSNESKVALTDIYTLYQHSLRLGQVQMHKGSEHHSPSNLDSIKKHAQQEHFYDIEIEFIIRSFRCHKVSII